jgi:hypothetical protein
LHKFQERNKKEHMDKSLCRRTVLDSRMLFSIRTLAKDTLQEMSQMPHDTIDLKNEKFKKFFGAAILLVGLYFHQMLMLGLNFNIISYLHNVISKHKVTFGCSDIRIRICINN